MIMGLPRTCAPSRSRLDDNARGFSGGQLSVVDEVRPDSAQVHLEFDLFNWRLAVVPRDAVRGGVLHACQQDVGQERMDGVWGVNIGDVNPGPIAAEAMQAGFHEVHDEAGLGLQAEGRSVPQSDDPFTFQYSLGEFTSARDDECQGRARGGGAGALL